MGTAVLFPQDCLQAQSRHNHHTSETAYPLECAPTSRRVRLTRAQSQEVGLLPLPSQGEHSSPVNIPRRGSHINDYKCRNGAEQRGIDQSPRTMSVTPVYKILQRPKQGDMAVNLLAQFVVVDDVMDRAVMVVEKKASTKGTRNSAVDGVDKSNENVKAEFGTLHDVKCDGVKHRRDGSDSKPVRVDPKGGSVYETKDMSRFLKGVRTSIAQGHKLSSAKVGAAKSNDALNDSVRGAATRMVTKPLMTKASGKFYDVSCKSAIPQGFEKAHSLPRLWRTSTEPQINCTLDYCKSKVTHASFQKSKSQSHAHEHRLFVTNSSLSCQERWAGPAYTSSPSPSSLPLPRLCLPQTRFSSLELPPLAKQYSSSVYTRPFLGSSVPSENGGAWDVAFATKSLRKMLNLDPC